MRHLIDLEQLSEQELDWILNRALSMHDDKEKFFDPEYNKILATLFYEPSTRTQMSFQSAMLRLGGQVIGFSDPSKTSVSKGETLKDTMKIISSYSDVIAMRNPNEGAAKAASLFSSCPVINAGDGGHLHPTQTLTDLVTLKIHTGRTNNLKIGLCGDLKYGRTVHSLCKALSHYEGNEFVLISTKELGVPSYILDILQERNCKVTMINDLKEAIGQLDILYMTRIQKERFEDEEEYNRLKNVYILDKEKLAVAREDLKVLHPLPKVDEITQEADEDPRCIYFDQARNGVFARMALIEFLLKDKEEEPEAETREYHCENPRCITKQEEYLPKLGKEVGGKTVCLYCEK